MPGFYFPARLEPDSALLYIYTVMKSDRPLAFVDLETTGLGPGTHRIAEIAVVTLERGRVEEWHTLVNPGGLSHEQRAVEGVSDEELAAAPKFEDIATELKRRLHG